MINVTKTFLPPFELYQDCLKKIWQSGWLTNHGPFSKELEEKLTNYLEVENFLFTNNGTIALQIAIKALDLKGEVITTPFSYVATTTSIVWEGCTPVFADIDPKTLNISPDSIESLITPSTRAILATHVYGIPCDVERLEEIARKHNLFLIYDAAHAFGCKYLGKSLVSYGDISILSFHATKLFHTVEGGALIAHKDSHHFIAKYMRSFGHNGPEHFFGLGTNGKNSEFHAAMGVCLFPLIEEIILERRMITDWYNQQLEDTSLLRPIIPEGTGYNFGYYPVIFQDEGILLKVKKALEDKGVNPRRYFYPSLNKLPYVRKQSVPVSEDVSTRVLCLPLYNGLTYEDVVFISSIVVDQLSK